MCAAVLFPKIDLLQAFPTIITQMDNVLTTIVVAGPDRYSARSR
jgi:SSS family solute:Na+ symporter